MDQKFCKHLRSKTMFVITDPQEALNESEDASSGGHCWCNRTQSVVGPDDRPVYTDKCNSSRKCYEK